MKEQSKPTTWTQFDYQICKIKLGSQMLGCDLINQQQNLDLTQPRYICFKLTIPVAAR